MFHSVLHNRKTAEGLPQLFCNCFIELHLLPQVEADDTVVIVDPVTVEVIHLSYNKTSTAISFPQDFKQQHLSSLLGETH